MAAKNTLQFFLGPLLKKFFQDMGRDPNNLEMILIKQKAGQLLKDSNKVIPFKQKRSFAEEIEAMKKSGDLVDEDNIIISDKITDREMFKNSNLNKPTIEGQMEKITGASNRIKEIQKEIDNMYKPKSDAEIAAKYDKQNKESIQRFKDKMKKDEPEDKADGGRIGFRAGKFVLDKIVSKLLGNPKKVKQAVDDIFPTGDYKYDAQMAADALVENNPKIFKNKLYEDLDLDTQMEIYGAVLGPIQKNMSMAIKMKKASRPEKTLAAMKEGKGIDMSDPNIADEFTRFMKETDPQGSKTIEQTVELANFDPKGRKKNATGGRAGYAVGNQVTPQVDARMNLDYDTLVNQNQAQAATQAQNRNPFKNLGLFNTQQHFDNNQLLKNAVSKGELSSADYNKLGGYDVTQTMGAGNPVLGGIGNLVGSTAYNAYQSIKDGQPILEGIKDIARNVQGGTGLISDDLKAQYESIINPTVDQDRISEIVEQQKAAGVPNEGLITNFQQNDGSSVIPNFEKLSDGSYKDTRSGDIYGAETYGSIAAGMYPNIYDPNKQKSQQPGSLEEYLSGYEKYKSTNPNTYKGIQALIDATLPGGIDYTFTGGAHASHFNDYLESIGLSPYQKNLNAIPEKVLALNKGGRAGFYTGGITDVEPSLDDIGHGSDSLMARTRLVSPGSQATTSTGLNYLLAEDNDNIRVPFSTGKLAGTYDYAEEENKALEERIARNKKMTDMLNKMYEDKAHGPFMTPMPVPMEDVMKLDRPSKPEIKVGPYSPEAGSGEFGAEDIYAVFDDGTVYYKDTGEFYDDTGKQVDGPSPGAKLKVPTMEAAEGGRIGFSAGGGGRRAFLKFLASIGGLTAAAKSGILGLGEGTTKKAITETVKQSAGNYPPPYFFKLVEKIKFMGDDITEKAATKDREIVKRYKDFEMTEDVATGDIVIKKRNEGSFYDQDGIVSDEYIVYKPGMADETTKGRKPPPEYDEYTVRPDAEGKLRDSEDGLDSIDEILEEVGDPDSMTLKKADGGRIGYVGGGLSKLGITGSSRRFLEKVFGKEKFKNLIENDPELHRGLLEVAEMFRSKDKAGLVEYMQNFLPKMSKKELEAFVVGSGDTAGIEGQLIRLGSGRDYKGKLDMIEEANNVRKLENFDIEGVSKNADGGRIGFDGGGSPLQRLRQSLVDDLMYKFPSMKEEDMQMIVKDINLDMSTEEAQASMSANFSKVFGKSGMFSTGGVATMLGE